MSSGLRGLAPAAVAIAVGVFTGYYTFQPAFKQLDAERRTKSQSVCSLVLPRSSHRSCLALLSQLEDAQPSTENKKSELPPNTKPYTSAWNAPPPLPPPVSAETPEDAAQPSSQRPSWTQWLWSFGRSSGTTPASAGEDRHLVQNVEKKSSEGQKKEQQ
ncbi:hypothetical protein T310_5201 [Rasamsonia emersonii CBS 393.64]|uniref:Uncharacterized protein n=1 Tax=Rasamsonia emersonii (strain ATCC 16479 / CBS 393.64 / IMI 116815) TaxID=1408163 RepID=A0A0F4YSG7_RASE3|nr:hypothetical protein T310_5201 [Rasamsonia emersonii CBS 393.64]KKA20786.1 hypothetical protein T310_5201 [Rasamsonia emersonii CBS 393.64]